MTQRLDSVFGLQWGDEAKAKIVDYLISQSGASYELGIRYGGGANAGHTVVIGDEKRIFHLVPSGGKKRVIADGVVIDLEELNTESEGFEDQLYISERSHLVTPQNRVFEVELEKARGKAAVGTTKRAIGPTYAMKMLRYNPRMCDLVNANREIDKDRFKAVLAADPLFDILEKTYGVKLSKDDIAEEFFLLGEKLRTRVVNTQKLIYEALVNGKDIIFEGAQGGMLDLDEGTYPYVTSSHPGVSGIQSGTGVAVEPTRRVGVMKAYTTRVGNGPFPTKLDDEIGEYIQEHGAEFGATTGRPRDCGWLDRVALNHVIMMNNPTELVVTKMDVLTGIDQIGICTHYDCDIIGVEHDFPARLHDLEHMKPHYEFRDGWEKDITGARTRDDLPSEVEIFVNRIAELLDTPVSMVTNGAEREKVIQWNNS